jgi:hypothetical protein
VDAVIRVYDAPGNVIETQEHAGDFKEMVSFLLALRRRLPLKGIFHGHLG